MVEICCPSQMAAVFVGICSSYRNVDVGHFISSFSNPSTSWKTSVSCFHTSISLSKFYSLNVAKERSAHYYLGQDKTSIKDCVFS